MEVDKETRSSLKGTYTLAVAVLKIPQRPGSSGDRSRNFDRIIAQEVP